MTKTRHGFTLIELLVVIAIILILAGMLFAAFSKVRQMAKKTRARAEVKQLDLAWRSMLSDYRTWNLSPVQGEKKSGVSMDATMVGYLFGGNDKGVVYMDFDSGSTNSSGAMIDPWYKSGDPVFNNSIYQVALGNYEVTPYNGAGGTLSRSVAVWSRGPNGTDDASNPDEDIQSWNIENVKK